MTQPADRRCDRELVRLETIRGENPTARVPRRGLRRSPQSDHRSFIYRALPNLDGENSRAEVQNVCEESSVRPHEWIASDALSDLW